MRLLVARVPRSARWLYVELGTFSARMLADGIVGVPPGMLSDSADLEADLAELVGAGLVERRDDQTLVLVEFLEHNKPGAELERIRAQNKARKRRFDACRNGDHSLCGRARKCPAQEAHALGDHSICSPDWCENVAGAFSERSDDVTERRTTRHDSTRSVGVVSTTRATRPTPKTREALKTDRHAFVAGDDPTECRHCSLPASNRHHLAHIDRRTA